MRKNMAHAILSLSPNFQRHKDVDPNTPIFHIYKGKYFDELLSGNMYFRRVRKWPDTYEYPIRFLQEDRRKVIERCLFGICFTQVFDTEAMWNLYSGEDSCGICIKTTVNKFSRALLPSLEESNAFWAPVKYVPYLESEPLKMFDEDDKLLYPDYMYSAYLKRGAFSYEQEMRLLILDYNSISNVKDGKKYHIQDLSFIDEIILHPKFPDNGVDIFISKFNDRNIQIPIRKSGLFKELDENSLPLPNEDKLYWGQPIGGITVD